MAAAAAASAGVGADLSAGGQTLNVAQRLAVTNALTKLKVNEKLPEITFWGKIFGVNNDYLIAVSISTGAGGAIDKRFYFSTDSGVSFARLPAADQWVRDKIRNVFSKIGALLFTGQPAFEHKDPTQPPEDPDAKDESTPPASPKGPAAVDPNKRKMTELERLAYTVDAIERATCVVPRGVVYLTPTGELSPNSAFKGLSAYDSKRLESYALYRRTEHAATLARVRKQGLANTVDCLDAVADDNADTKGVWTVQSDAAGQVVTLRHAEWPGFEFRHAVGTSVYGRAYFGYGEKNTDVNFML